MTQEPPGRTRTPRGGTARRLHAMLEEVLAGRGDIAELAAHFEVSASTIRRDLARLADAGHIHRTYGGAVAGQHPVERTLREKESGRRAEKEAIAGAAAERVGDGDVVVLDAGTTTGRLARRLGSREGITVVTNSTTALRHLADAQGVDLVVLGGRVRRPNGAILGPAGEQTLRRLTADRVFLGADGLHPVDGLSCPSPELAGLKELMMERGQEVYVLADSSKLNIRPFPFHALPRGKWTLITDGGAEPSVIDAFHRAPGCSILIAR